jgi:glycosyltransferase involved in cell wall biosynthesis
MVKHQVKVSVIMPTYNRANLIARSIKSVLRQTLADFELIIIDDVSTDHTETLVRGYQDSRIKYIKRTVNHLVLYRETGQLDNPRNDGLKLARGQYIAYLDSDDLFKSYLLEEMSDFLDRNPDVAMAYGDAVWHRNLDGKNEQANCNMSVDFGPKVIRIRNIIRTPTVMHRREIVDQIGYFKPIKIKVPHPGIPYVGIEDWDYWLRISQQFKVKHHPVIVAHKINETSDHYWDVDFDPEFAEAPRPDQARLFENKDIFYQIRVVNEFRRLAELFETVTGYLSPGEGHALMLLAAHGYGLGEIVEIGSFLGRSTCWLAHGTKMTGREKITAVDHFRGSPEHQAGKKHECGVLVEDGTTYHRFMENITRLQVADFVSPVVAGSETAAATWTSPIRLLFIDGNHSYDASRQDFEMWSRHLIPGGYVGFHDIDGWPGVTTFYRELLAGNPDYEEVLAVDSLRVVRKKRPG